MDGFLPIVIMIGLGVGFAGGSVLLSQFVGSIKFYLVAMIFLLFDIEIAFLYPWALAFRDLGMTGFLQILTFFALLTTGYIYVWRKGIFDWSGERQR